MMFNFGINKEQEMFIMNSGVLKKRLIDIFCKAIDQGIDINEDENKKQLFNFAEGSFDDLTDEDFQETYLIINKYYNDNYQK